MIFGNVFVIIFLIVLANHFDKPGFHFDSACVPELQESIPVKEQELLKYELSRRADFKTRPVFIEEKMFLMMRSLEFIGFSMVC